MITIKTKNSVLWIGITILLASAALMGDFAIYPAADAIFNHFPDTHITILNFILSGTSLMIIFASLLCGVMAQYYSKKVLLVISYSMFFVCAFFGAAVDNAVYMAVMRGLTGIAMGFIGTLLAGLIAELFVDEQKRSTMMGLYTAIMAVLGSLISLGAGYLAVNDWHLVFRIYLFALPIIALMLIFIPYTPPEGKQAEGEAVDEKFPVLPVLGMTGTAFIVNAMYGVIMTMVAVFLAEEAIGDAATAGIMGSLGTVGSCIGCLVFIVLYMRFKHFVPALFSLLMGAAYLTLGFSENTIIIGILCTILGSTYGLGYSYFLMHASVIVPASRASLAIAFANAGIYLGLFSGPYVPMVFQGIFNVDTIAATMPYMAALLGIVGIILSFNGARTRNLEKKNA